MHETQPETITTTEPRRTDPFLAAFDHAHERMRKTGARAIAIEIHHTTRAGKHRSYAHTFRCIEDRMQIARSK